VIKCRAAVAWEAKKPFVVEEVEVAPPKAHEIRIRIYNSGICHTDDHALGGFMDGIKFPIILGHEGAGIVESIGEGVTSVKPGDHVIPLCSPMCMKCVPCLHPDSNFCVKNDVGKNVGLMLDNTSRFTCKGKLVYHFMSVSTFSEYTVVDEIAVVKIDPKAPMDQVCLIGCGFSTGYGSAINTAKVQRGSSCAVIGLGGIGLSVVMGCKAAGAKRIIGIDNNSRKFDLAKKFGCTECLNPDDHKEPIHEIIAKKTDGGVDFSFECVGKINLMESAIQMCHFSFGVCTIIGVPPSNELLCFPPLWILSGRTIKGAFLGDCKAKEDFPKFVKEVIEGKIDLASLVTHKVPFEKINEGFNNMREGICARTVINMK
ncbi:hypothetical protein GDO86_000711, partial [Hymenochirus boettgeri]